MRGSSLRHLVGGVAVAAAVMLAAGVGASAQAAPPNRVNVVPLVADQAGQAPLVDPAVVNAWGLALSPSGPLWVANNGTNTATVYAGGLNGATPTKAPLTVTIPGGAPTGQVFNDTAGFVIPGGAKALFIFDGEEGDITAWNPAQGTRAVTVAHVEGANYKGLAILHVGAAAFLLAADFHNARVDVFDAAFHRIAAASALFTDPGLPARFAPFNVFTVGSAVYVAYAMQDEDAEDEVTGGGLGFVDRYDALTGNVQRIASRGTLNAPWGMAIAPASFGSFAGALLVGNFGDGRIGAYRGDHFSGLLHARRGGPVRIDGLWALQPGTATTGGTGALWFSAGPDDETHGLIGEILPVT